MLFGMSVDGLKMSKLFQELPSEDGYLHKPVGYSTQEVSKLYESAKWAKERLDEWNPPDPEHPERCGDDICPQCALETALKPFD